MKKSEQYLEKLRSERDFWQDKQDQLPGRSISVDNPTYRMAVSASNRYAAALYLWKLMQEEAQEK